MPKSITCSLLFVVACAPAIEYVPTTSIVRPGRLPPEAVAVFLGQPPCAYTELGFVETSPFLPKSHADQLWELRTAAGQNGANAIIVVDHREPSSHHHGNGEGGFTAIAVELNSCSPQAAASGTTAPQ